MRINSLLLATALLAFTAMFSSCSKEPQTPTATTPTSTDVDTEVADRGMCNVTVRANNCSVNVCGAQNAVAQCGVFGGMNLFGNDFIANGVTNAYLLNTPTAMIVTLNPAFPFVPFPSITVTSGPVVKVYNFVPPFTVTNQLPPIVVKIDNFCNPS
jgi:hypothetical protein